MAFMQRMGSRVRSAPPRALEAGAWVLLALLSFDTARRANQYMCADARTYAVTAMTLALGMAAIVMLGGVACTAVPGIQALRRVSVFLALVLGVLAAHKANECRATDARNLGYAVTGVAVLMLGLHGGPFSG